MRSGRGPPSSIASSIDTEPRICPAFQNRALTPGPGVEPLRQAVRRAVVEAGLGIGLGVDRLDWRLALAPQRPVLPLDLALLDLAAVRQHEGEEIERRRGGMDRPGEAAAGQLGHQAAVVDMGVGEEEIVDGGGIEGKGRVVQFADRGVALEHAAVDEEASAIVLDQIAGAGDGPRAAAKSDLRRHGLVFRCRAVRMLLRPSCHETAPEATAAARAEENGRKPKPAGETSPRREPLCAFSQSRARRLYDNFRRE